MRFLLSLIAVACHVGGTEVGDHDIKKTTATAPTWHYAKYRFLATGHEGVDIAVRIWVSSGNVPQVLETKDLHPYRREWAVGKIDLKKPTMFCDVGDGDGTYDYNDFWGENSHVIDGIDYGGRYFLTFDPTSTNDGCCGMMFFRPNTNKDVSFVGTKQAPEGNETFDKAWWDDVTVVPEKIVDDGLVDTASNASASGEEGREYTYEACEDLEIHPAELYPGGDDLGNTTVIHNYSEAEYSAATDDYKFEGINEGSEEGHRKGYIKFVNNWMHTCYFYYNDPNPSCSVDRRDIVVWGVGFSVNGDGAIICNVREQRCETVRKQVFDWYRHCAWCLSEKRKDKSEWDRHAAEFWCNKVRAGVQ